VDSDIRHSDAFAESRSRICNSLLKGLSILGTPILLFSLYRFYQFGWQPIGSIHVLAVAALISGAILKNRLPFWIRSSICIGTIGFVGVSGIFAFGVTASSGAYIPFASVFAALLHNQRSGILVLSFLTLVTGAIEGLYLSGLLNIGPEVYGVWLNPVEWAIRLGSWFMLALAAILGIGMITTDAANTLEQLSEQKVALESSQRQYRGLFENVVDIVYRTDTDGKFVELSPSVFNLLGFKPEELLGLKITDFYVNPAERENLQELLRTTDGTITNFVASLYNKAGIPQILSTNLQIWKDDSGQILGIEGVSRNITEQRAIEEALQPSQKVDALGQLTGGLAHDFNNLLAIVMGNAELLLSRFKAKDTAGDAVREIIQATEHGAALTRRLLAYSRPDALTPAQTDIDATITGLERMLRSALSANISLDFDLLSDNAVALVDENQLEASILNLVINARDAMPDGGVISISTAMDLSSAQTMTTVNVTRELKFIGIRVADNGSGMAPEIAEKAKEPFYTSKPIGTGLGLSMVDRFVTESQGHMSIETELGRGTTVSLFVPQISTEKAAKRIDETKANQAQIGKKAKILVVEDSSELLALMCRILRPRGYEVLTAEDGETAINIASNEPEIDLVISDIMLPGKISGWDVYRNLSEQRNEMKYLLITGYSSEEQDDLEVPILYKPFRQEELLSKVNQILS
jgi:PAS domain S-box-containing protein